MSSAASTDQGTEAGTPRSLGRWFRRQWARDWVRGPILVLYYLGLIYVMIQLYGSGVQQAPPPFIYQGF